MGSTFIGPAERIEESRRELDEACERVEAIVRGGGVVRLQDVVVRLESEDLGRCARAAVATLVAEGILKQAGAWELAAADAQ